MDENNGFWIRIVEQWWVIDIMHEERLDIAWQAFHVSWSEPK